MPSEYPAEYIEEIKRLLGGTASLFWDEIENGSVRAGLRLNTLKAGVTQILDHLPGPLAALPWTAEGFGISPDQVTGQHSFHAAGLFYLQEPSAMIPVEVLDPQPGEMVLDLCAAPGGKTTQILSKLQGSGVLVANDPNPARVKALELNLNRWGARNALITCESPGRLADHFGACFDRVLVDAPCSGEGTFRSHPSEIRKWSLSFSARCAAIQDEILWFAAKLVRPGGKLAYSTCTFNQLENEGTLDRFLNNNPDFKLDPIPHKAGFFPGITPAGSTHDLSAAVRIWPHHAPGEGHFTSLLSKSMRSPGKQSQQLFSRVSPRQELAKGYAEFYRTALRGTPRTLDLQPGNPRLRPFGNRLYLMPEGSPDLEGLTVQSWGWWIGSLKEERFLPSPALAAGITGEDAQKVLEFSLGDPGLQSYLRGSTAAYDAGAQPERGWVLVTVAGYPLGWGKLLSGKLKSCLPAWLRTT